jgi:DNA polymerase
MEKNIQNYLLFLKNRPAGTIYVDTINQQEQACPNREKGEKLKALREEYFQCTRCPLSTQGRTSVVFGAGNPYAQLMFIGEGPGKEEDRQGLPFVGKAGQLLTKILNAMNMKREDVYISNVVKCRPPQNRTPLPNETQICKNEILFKEIDIIKPRVICTLGSVATQELLNLPISISKARGTFFSFGETPVMPTFHPAYLLRNGSKKKEVWQDMQKIMEKLKTVPK